MFRNVPSYRDNAALTHCHEDQCLVKFFLLQSSRQFESSCVYREHEVQLTQFSCYIELSNIQEKIYCNSSANNPDKVSTFNEYSAERDTSETH